MSLFEQIRAAQWVLMAKVGQRSTKARGGRDKSGQIGNAPDCMRPVQVSSMPINVPKNVAAMASLCLRSLLFTFPIPPSWEPPRGWRFFVDFPNKCKLPSIQCLELVWKVCYCVNVLWLSGSLNIFWPQLCSLLQCQPPAKVRRVKQGLDLKQQLNILSWDQVGENEAAPLPGLRPLQLQLLHPRVAHGLARHRLALYKVPFALF